MIKSVTFPKKLVTPLDKIRSALTEDGYSIWYVSYTFSNLGEIPCCKKSELYYIFYTEVHMYFDIMDEINFQSQKLLYLVISQIFSDEYLR